MTGGDLRACLRRISSTDPKQMGNEVVAMPNGCFKLGDKTISYITHDFGKKEA